MMRLLFHRAAAAASAAGKPNATLWQLGFPVAYRRPLRARGM
jgi:hypothetical protein